MLRPKGPHMPLEAAIQHDPEPLERLEEAVITRIEGFGLGFVESRSTGERYAFRFDKIDGYRGETLRELGLHEGSTVLIEVDGPYVRSVHKQ